MSGLHNRVKKLEAKTEAESIFPDNVIIHDNGLPESEQIGVVRVIEIIEGDEHEQPKQQT